MEGSDRSGGADLEGAFYTAVGFAVLGFQRLQVARRDLPGEMRSLARWLADHLGDERSGSTDR